MRHGPTPGFLVWRLATRWQAAVDRALAPLDLTHAQYSMIASLRGMLRECGRPSQRALADHTGLDPIFVSKLIRALEDKGLVAREADPDDARAVRLRLTRSGQDLADRAIKTVIALQEKLLEPLGGLNAPATRRFVETLEGLLDATRERNEP